MASGAAQVHIPEDRLQISFTRSSGAGGQNVNKVNTKVEVRFVVDEADWLEYDVRQRLKEYQAGRVNKTGELIVTCQEHRTQKANRMEAIAKLREMIADALLAPKERAMRVGIGEATKRQRRDDKRFRSKVKATRGRVRSDD